MKAPTPAVDADKGPLSSKTVIGGITWAIGWLLSSGIIPPEHLEIANALGNVLIAIGSVIAAYGVWHGQQKVKQTVAINNPSGPQTVVK